MFQSNPQSHKTVYDWIGGKPVVSDETNFDWSGGVPRIVYEYVPITPSVTATSAPTCFDMAVL
jgi:hypothetical protein